MLRRFTAFIGLSMWLSASHYANYMSENYVHAIREKVENITSLASTFAAGLRMTVHCGAPLAPQETSPK
jgi:hypothetical protein